MITKRGPGRPPSGEPQRTPMQIRFSADERAVLAAAARAVGLPVGTWIRQQVLAAAAAVLSGNE